MSHPLVNLLKESDFSLKSYSGRYMYGAKCLGVIIPRESSLGELIAFVIEYHNPDFLNEIAFAFKGMKMDTLGLDAIVYFLSVPYNDEDEDDDDDEDDDE